LVSVTKYKNLDVDSFLNSINNLYLDFFYQQV